MPVYAVVITMFDVDVLINTVVFLVVVVPIVVGIAAYIYQIIKGIR